MTFQERHRAVKGLSPYKQIANVFKSAAEAKKMPYVFYSHNVANARSSTQPNTSVLNDKTQT